MRIDVIAGARPNFIKVASVIRAIETVGRGLCFRLIHTGQHYDPRMSGDFFSQLGIPEPHFNLEVGSGSAAEQTGAIMVGYERVLEESRSDACVVVGDVTSTLACAITAQKLHVPVAHVEAGIRSGDWSMPEEINRLATDAVSNWFFTTSEHANANLRRTGVSEDRIFFVGNTMIDTLLANAHRLLPPAFADELGLQPGRYLVITLHRPANVDEAVGLARLLRSIADAADGRTVVFPAHPRTLMTLRAIGRLPDAIRVVEPQPYLEFIWLMKHAAGVITDSGGVTEETTAMGVPCITLRDTTERPETIELGTNELIGTDPTKIAPALARLLSGNWKSGSIPPLWDGHAGERIVAHLERLLAK